MEFTFRPLKPPNSEKLNAQTTMPVAVPPPVVLITYRRRRFVRFLNTISAAITFVSLSPMQSEELRGIRPHVVVVDMTMQFMATEFQMELRDHLGYVGAAVVYMAHSSREEQCRALLSSWGIYDPQFVEWTGDGTFVAAELVRVVRELV